MVSEAVRSPVDKAGDGAVYLVLFAALAVFGLGLEGSFHFDDFSLFSDPAVTSPSGWLDVWRPLRTRPITYLTFWLNYQIGGRNPIGYHALNLALHLLAVWLLYGNLRRLIGEKAAVMAAAIFALHPIQSEPVLYIFERATLISTVFCLLCWRSWLDRRHWLAAVWFVLAMLSKEECVTFPLFLLMFQRAYLPVAAMLGVALVGGARVIMAYAALHLQAVSTGAQLIQITQVQPRPVPHFETIGHIIAGYFQTSLLPYFWTQGMVILRYFRMLLLPYGFTVDPDIPIVRDWRGGLAWGFIILITVLLWKNYRHGKWLAAGLILLAPSSSIFPAADLAADRRLYLPMLAFATLAGLLLSHINQWIVLATLVAGLSILSFYRTLAWSTERTLWTEAVARSPRKVRPLLYLSRASDPEAALRLLDRAQVIAPADPRPWQEKGLRLLGMRRPDLALAQFNRGLSLLPGDPDLFNNRGVTQTLLGQRRAAIEDFEHALQADPCLATARRNLERLGIGYDVACR